METEENIVLAGWLAVRATYNGTTEMSQGNQACDGSSTVVAGSAQETILQSHIIFASPTLRVFRYLRDPFKFWSFQW